MRFSLTHQQSSYFTDNGFIEFDELLSDDVIRRLRQELKQEVSKRLNYSFERCSAEQIYRAGRDLWRENDYISKLVRKVGISGLAAEVFHEQPLRLAYDQCICGGLPFEDGQSLEEMSSIQGLVGGLLICVDGDLEREEKAESTERKLRRSVEDAEPDPIDVFSPHRGSAIFFAPDRPLIKDSLAHDPRRCYLLIAYATMRPVYVRRAGDPHAHGLKDYDYVFGDTLKEETHPLVFR